MYLRARSDWKAINSLFRGCCPFSPKCNTAKDLSKLPRIREQRSHLGRDKGRRGQGFLPAGQFDCPARPQQAVGQLQPASYAGMCCIFWSHYSTLLKLTIQAAARNVPLCGSHPAP